MSDFCVARCQTRPLSGKSSFIPECDPRAISRRNLSGTTLDLPERGVNLAFGDTEVTHAVSSGAKFGALS